MVSQLMRPREGAIFLRGRGRILLAGCASEPGVILDAVSAEPDLWKAETITGAFIPGVNERCLGVAGRIETIFGIQGARGDGVVHLPLHYSSLWARLVRPGLIGAVVMTVPPVASDGTVGYGLACDFTPGAIAAGAVLVGVVNPMMPDVAHGPRLAVSRFAALVDGEAPLAELIPSEPDAVTLAIADHILTLLRDDDTLQLGLGRLQAAVLSRLASGGPSGLAYHAGMVTEGTLADGVFPGGITTGVALGDAAFYAGLGRADRLRFAPVGWTHAISTLAAIPNFVSVNSAIAIDLSGQVNAEYVGKQVSGQGGMVDFIRGARASVGGRSILALPSTARSGTESRIVAGFPWGTPVSVARGDVDLIVTEYGIADLREADVATRAQRLATIAAPQFRDALLAAARGAS